MQDSIHASPTRWLQDRPTYCRHAVILGVDAASGDPDKVLCAAGDRTRWADPRECERCGDRTCG